MSVGVVIVAAGRGERIGGAVPKQLLEIGGRSLLRRSVELFDRHPAVREIVVVLPAGLIETGAAAVGATMRPVRLVAGGARRQDSVRLGFEAVSSDLDVVLIHDAARPFASASLIDRVIGTTVESGAAVPALQARDTVKRVDRLGTRVRETIPRDEIWLAQTPQGFRRRVLADAVALGAAGIEATDEAMLAERAGHEVRVVPGEPGNIKITTPDDLSAARTAASTPTRAGTGYDLHRLVEGRPLILAGVTVPSPRGPEAHSDGDVVCHAVIDALLGAAAAGDIGQHFPNTDAAWKSAAGLDLLGRALAVVGAAGWAPVNVDVTVILERPKLAQHVEAVRAALARQLGLAVDCVSVKAKTNEGVDAVGRGEAIAAHAVALLERCQPRT